MEQRDIDRLAYLASTNIEKSILTEPRVYYDAFTLDGLDSVVRGDPDAFRNQEQFPVRITHLSANMLWRQPVADDSVLFTQENKVQAIGLNLANHDEYYMSDALQPLPQWSNQMTSQAYNVTQSTSSWQLPCPVVLSSRDSLRVEVAGLIDPRPLVTDPAVPVFGTGYTVGVSFTGIGALSKRPYFFGSTVELPFAPGTVRLFNPTDLRNNGAEPVILTDMTLTSPGFTAGPTDYFPGNAQLFDVQIRQQGNGTNADWFRGPSVPAIRPRCPATLLGYNGGRSLVHRFPGDGLIWEPGDGVIPQLAALVDGLEETISQVDYQPLVGVTAMGYLSVV